VTAVQPVHVSAYIELLKGERSGSRVKRHPACIRMLFDRLVYDNIAVACTYWVRSVVIQLSISPRLRHTAGARHLEIMAGSPGLRSERSKLADLIRLSGESTYEAMGDMNIGRVEEMTPAYASDKSMALKLQRLVENYL